MDMNWVSEFQPDAVMYVWHGGMEGGHAVADLLTGRTTPSGKLTDTIAMTAIDYPSAKNFGGDQQAVYQEDIYTGYRWFETFARDRVLSGAVSVRLWAVLVTGKIAAAQLKGMQRLDVTGTMKHFACNNQEYRRRELNSVISERALREIYLKGFEIAVREAGAYSIMTTYGALNGIWTAGNYDLNLTILRNEWGFEGIVMSDWWAAIYDEGEQPSGRNTAAMVRSQNDLYMVVNDAEKNSSHDNLEEQLAQGTLTRGQLQRSASNILNMLMRSPAMTRFVSRVSEEELEAVRQLDPDDQVDFDIRYLPMKERLELDAKGCCTDKGTSLVYGIQIEIPGSYDLHLRLHVDAEALAQVPVTIFANGKNMGTITFQGGCMDSVQITRNLGLFVGTNNYVKLYFAQSGIRLEEIAVSLREKLTKPFWE